MYSAPCYMTKPCQSNLPVTLAHPKKTAQIFPKVCPLNQRLSLPSHLAMQWAAQLLLLRSTSSFLGPMSYLRAGDVIARPVFHRKGRKKCFFQICIFKIYFIHMCIQCLGHLKEKMTVGKM
jgi:hypothetical protein